MNYQDHEYIGSMLKRMYDDLTGISVLLCNSYKHKSISMLYRKSIESINDALLSICKLRSVLDDNVFIEFPDRSSELLVNIYYGEREIHKDYHLEYIKLKESFNRIVNEISEMYEEQLNEARAYNRNIERNRITSSVRFNVFNRDGFACCACGRTPKDGVAFEVDHIVPISKGGSSDMDNLQTLCRECNRGKHTKQMNN